MKIIPSVKSLKVYDDDVSLDGIVIKNIIDDTMTGEQYKIVVDDGGARLIAGNDVGLFRAKTTFEQIRKNCGVVCDDGCRIIYDDNRREDHHNNSHDNCHNNSSGNNDNNHNNNRTKKIPHLEIYDEPDFAVRGFYHDVTRGRVPTLDTLKKLVDTLAYYKINQLQLYVEHTFAFESLPELWKDKDPLTSNDILQFDKYCQERYIDLVPSLSTFGHLYELLRLPKYEHLNELDIRASQTPRCLWDRMAHYTLNASDPESFEIVRKMIDEYAPLFSSRYFNICCDETFDLGTGKNADRAKRDGVGRLYVDFVKKIIAQVLQHGKIPMLWGDIILKHPELITEISSLSNDVIFLNWEYTPEVTYDPVKTFKDAGVNQYVCPGVNGWSRFATDVDRATTNISKMVTFGKQAGAAGVLNTDWGDCGQVNLLATSYHGLTFGAELSWNCDVKDLKSFDERFSFLQWGLDDNGKLGKLLRELGALSEYHFGNLYAWVNDKKCLWFKEDDVKKLESSTLIKKYHRAGEIVNEFENIYNLITDENRQQEFEEYIWSANATKWLLSILILKKEIEYNQKDCSGIVDKETVITDGHTILEKFKTLWMRRNHESELRDVVETFEKIFDKITSY